MSFLHPWLLLGALGAAVPVLLHFFGRRRARRVPFSSLLLIQQAQRERSALMRVRQLLLMILRALAILLLALALARPVLPLRGGVSRTLVVLDDTPSMRAMDALGLYREAGGDARQALYAAVRRLAGDRHASGVLLSEMPYPHHAAPDVSDRARYRTVDNAPRLAHDDGDGGDGDSPAVIFFTDLQATSWLTPARLPRNRQVVVVDCGRDTPNRSLLGVEPREPTVIAGRPTELVVTGRGTPGLVPVRIVADGRDLGAVSLHMGPEPTQAVFEWRADGPGRKRLQAVLPDDAMPEDNACYVVVPVRQRLRVLILGQGPAERLMALALAPEAGSPVEVRSVAALPNVIEADAVIVSQPPPTTEVAALKQAAAAGLGLIVMTPQLSVAVLRALTGDGELALKPARPGPLHLGEFDVFRPPLRPFANPQAGDLRQPEFKQTPELDVRPTHWHIAARFEDGSVAIAARERVVLVNLPLGPTQTDLPQQPVFVPLLHRLVGCVARQAEPEVGPALVGQPLGLPDPDAQGHRPGFQRLIWTSAGSQHETVCAVNLDPAEGDLRRTTVAHVKQCLQGKVSVVRPAADGTVPLPPLTGAGTDLVGPLLLTVLLLLLAELALSQGLRFPAFGRRGTS